MTRRPELHEREPRHRPAVGAVLAVAVTGALGWALWTLPRGDNPLPAIAAEAMRVALPDWHTTEPVNEVVYGTRGFDTFGETYLLLAAIIGIVVLTRTREPRRGFIGEQAAGAREQAAIDPSGMPASGTGHPVDDPAEDRAEQDEEWQAREAEREELAPSGRRPAVPDATPLGVPGPERAASMTVPVRGAVRVVAPVLAVAGVYLAAWGYSPGGGFPAGAVLLGVALLAYAALGYGRVEAVLRPGVVEPVELAGALAIVVIAVGGLLFAGSVTANFLPLGPPESIRSGGVLQAFSGAELVEVATGLIIAVFAMLGMEHDWAADRENGAAR